MPDQTNDRLDSQGTVERNLAPESHQFPLADLNSAVEAARVFKQQGVDVCDFVSFKRLVVPGIPGGDNSREIEAAEVFGFTVRRDDLVFLTQLGQSVLDPAKTAEARVEAFLSVPLYAHLCARYRDALLPNIKEMDYELERVGVPAQDRATVRIVFHRSAMFAGFFSLGSHRLVKPVLRKSGPAPARPVSVPALRPGGNQGAATPVSNSRSNPHPVIEALVASLPTPGSVWTLDQRRKWLQSAATNFDYLYQSTDLDSGSLRVAIEN
jgi:hypothetical protein